MTSAQTRLCLVGAALLALVMLAGCGTAQTGVKVLANDHDVVTVDYRRGADIEGLENPTPNDYEIHITIRGQLKPGDDDPMAALSAAGAF